MKESKAGRFLREDPYNTRAFMYAFASVPVQQLIERSIVNPQLLPIVPYSLIYNSGDFAEAFLFASTTNTFLRAVTPKLSPKARIAAAATVSTGLLVGMETVQFHHPISYITGTADLGDLPAGIIGVGAYALGAVVSERRAASQKRRQTPLRQPAVS